MKTRYCAFWAITGVDSSAGARRDRALDAPKGPDTGFSDSAPATIPLVYDWNGDGKDEVMGGYDFMDSDRRTLWSVTTLGCTRTRSSPATWTAIRRTARRSSSAATSPPRSIRETAPASGRTPTRRRCSSSGLGDYRPDLAGLEVALLDRLRTEALGLKSNNVLLDRRGTLLWRENRPNNSGWLTVTENLNNWDGRGSDFIFSYRRGSGGGYLYDGDMATVATFPYPGTNTEQNFALHADLCGDAREEVIIYDDAKAWIYANGGCDLSAPPRTAQPSPAVSPLQLEHLHGLDPPGREVLHARLDAVRQPPQNRPPSTNVPPPPAGTNAA